MLASHRRFLETLKEEFDERTRIVSGCLELYLPITCKVWVWTAESVNTRWQMGTPIPDDHVVLCVRVGKKHEVVVKLDIVVPTDHIADSSSVRDLCAKIVQALEPVRKLRHNVSAPFPYRKLSLGGH